MGDLQLRGRRTRTHVLGVAGFAFANALNHITASDGDLIDDGFGPTNPTFEMLEIRGGGGQNKF